MAAIKKFLEFASSGDLTLISTILSEDSSKKSGELYVTIEYNGVEEEVVLDYEDDNGSYSAWIESYNNTLKEDLLEEIYDKLLSQLNFDDIITEQLKIKKLFMKADVPYESKYIDVFKQSGLSIFSAEVSDIKSMFSGL